MSFFESETEERVREKMINDKNNIRTRNIINN